MLNRKVKVFKGWDKKDFTIALFHEWGVDYDEFTNYAGNYSTAIVEMEDGKVRNVRVGLIEFIK